MIIQLESGTKLNVPDGSSPSDIDDVVQHYQAQGGAVSAPAQADISAPKTLEQTIAPENVIPKVISMVTSPLTNLASKTFDADKAQFTQAFPQTSAVIGNAANAVGNVLNTDKNAVNGAIQSSPAAQAIVNGPVVGAASDTMKVLPAVIPVEGALEGAAADASSLPPSGSPPAGSPPSGFFSKPNVTQDMVKAEAQKGYQYADSAGGVISPQGRNDFINTVNSLHPPSSEVPVDPAYQGVLDTINARKGQPLTLQGAQDLSEYLGDKINDEVLPNGQLTSTGKKLMDVQTDLRGLVRNPDPASIIGGSNGFDAWQQAQSLWQKQAQLGDIQQIITKATAGNVSNPAQALQNGFARLATNPKRFNQYAPEIQDLITNASQGSIGVDALKSLGSRLIPQIAGAVHGPLAGIAGEAASIVGRRGAAAVQLGKANNVAKAIAGNNWQFVEPAAEEAAPEAQKLLPSPENMSALPMTDQQIAQAQAQLRPTGGNGGGVTDTSGSAIPLQNKTPSEISGMRPQDAVNYLNSVNNPSMGNQMSNVSPGVAAMRSNPASWVIKNKNTGEAIMETFDKNKVNALNTDKYEAVPIIDYLASLNKKGQQ